MYEYASAKTVDFSEIPVISVANISRPDQLHNCGEAIVKAAGNVGFSILLIMAYRHSFRQMHLRRQLNFLALMKTTRLA